MPKLDFTAQELKGYFKENVRHHFYKETVEKAKAMCVHADGIFPDDLIKSRRPHEPSEVLDYREKIFIPKTKPTFSKIVSSLSKIRRSADWSIKYDQSDKFSKIIDQETLENYCEKYFPDFTSMTNWVFSVLLKEYLIDPNAVVFTFPKEFVIAENEYLRPFPVIFKSENVIDFVPNDYAALINPLGSTYYVRNKPFTGDSYYLVTTQRIVRIDQIDSKGSLSPTVDFAHNLNLLPVFRIGAIVTDSAGSNYLHESRIAAIIPELDEAIREYSDLQAAKVLHIYPERWEYTNNECTHCNGIGKVIHEETRIQSTCSRCQGVGHVAAGPYSKILVKPQNTLEQGGIPMPPAGFIEKDVDIVKIQDDGVDKHIYNALASINFQFLEQTPQNQSGTAKEVDKDELNNTVHSIAEDLVRVMDIVYKHISLYRYGLLYDQEDIINEMLPEVTVPEKYDILSSAHLEQELSIAKQNKANPVILNALEIEYASKKFNTDTSIRDRLMLILQLDPLPNVTEDEKMSRLSNKGITQESYIISSNIQEFVQEALEEKPDFATLPLKDQKAKMREYAKAQVDAVDAAKAIVKSIIPDTGLDQNNQPVNAAV